jgi:hypothetical protein
MNSILDILFAFIIAGMLILASLQVDTNVKSHAVFMRHDLNAQENLHVFTEMVEYDLRKIGHGLNQPKQGIHLADSSRIIFSYNTNRSGGYDSIRVEYRFVKQQNDKNEIRRYLNGNRRGGGSLGVSRFFLQYINRSGDVLAVPVVADSIPSIRQVNMLLTVQSQEGYNGERASATYSTKIAPKNLMDY